MLKVCSRCNREMTLDNFVPSKRYRFGVTSQCKKCISETRKSRAGCEKTKEYQQQYYYRNRDTILSNPNNKLRVKKWVENNREVHRERGRVWSQNNPSYGRYKTAKRRAHQKNSTPVWLSTENKEFIREMYQLCETMESKFGLKYHVDHIVPLQGENVCGLHVPWNLQILESSLNIAKSNKF